MINACKLCFHAITWLEHPEAAGTVGECSFGHSTPPQTWPVTAWSKAVQRLLTFYEIAEDDDAAAEPVFTLIQKDWSIFAFDDEALVSMFVREAVGADPLLEPGVRARLKSVSGLPDHVALWEEFASELKQRNRYFPSVALNEDDLAKVFWSGRTTVRSGETLFRARQLGSSVQVTEGEIGPPPPALATGGRANPAGIPYLYLSFTAHTSRHEVRAPNQSEIVVAEFRVKRDLKVLNLTSLIPPDLFEDDAVSGLHQYRYLRRLGEELGKPVRESDAQTDYVPTQYLCEYAKSLGYNGVVYPSAVDPSSNPGRNFVLFDATEAEWTGNHKRYRVTRVEAEFEELV